MIQLAATIYLKAMKTMKSILDLGGFRLDKRTKEFTYFKEEVMNHTYNNLNKVFQELEKDNIVEKCPCGTNIRKGYKNCLCKGSGFINKIQKDK